MWKRAIVIQSPAYDVATGAYLTVLLMAIMRPDSHSGQTFNVCWCVGVCDAH